MQPISYVAGNCDGVGTTKRAGATGAATAAATAGARPLGRLRALDGGRRLCHGLLDFCGDHRRRCRRLDRLGDNGRFGRRLDGDHGRYRLGERRLEHDFFDRQLGCRVVFDYDLFEDLGQRDFSFDELDRRHDRHGRRHRGSAG
ncbi:MAG: hypothetical protein IPJ97_00420 [Proteobacteria bacterium]|nr:hypothetical protein [Pseudomonadota bacterium]